MSTYNYAPGAIHNDNHKEITINGANASVGDIVKSFFNEEKPKEKEVEDIEPIDTSFFGTDRYAADVCEKNLRDAIDFASGKADACRRIMTANACGYIHIGQFTDARKAELINPFASPKYTFTGDDFKKARNR